MKYSKTLINIIQGCQLSGSPVIVYCNDQKELVREVYEATEVMISTKRVPDYYYNSEGYSRFRINIRQLTLSINNGS